MLKPLLTEVKAELQEAGINSFDYLPERLNPPVAIVSPGEPFVEEGDTFTTFKVTLDVVLVAGKATNVVSTDQLYDLIDTAIFNLGDWKVSTVQRPYQLEANGAYYLATTLTISKFTEIGD